MPFGVIDVLEFVEIDHDRTGGLAQRLQALLDRMDMMLPSATIGDAVQLVLM